MNAETKAKRRLTLSLAGLGALDESEIETTGGHRVTVDHETGEIVPPSPRRGAPLTPEALLGGAVTVETGVEPGDRAPAPPEPVSGAPGADPAPADPPPSDLELGLARSAAVAAMDRLKLTPSERAYLIKQHAKVERLEAASLDGVNVLLDALQKVRPKSG
jgi:hypothetical protein